jgi:hypothetical protein
VTHKNLVYRKSAKGSEAIATRQHGLSPKARSLLILINGKRDLEELTRLAGVQGDPQQLVGQLLHDGFIEEVPGASASESPTPAPAPTPAGAASALSLGEAQRFATRRLLALLGPTAEPICLRIEATRTAPDFQASIKRAEALVRELRGSHVAADFAAEMQAHQPTL